MTKEELTTVTLFYDAFYDFGVVGMVFFGGLLGVSAICWDVSEENSPAPRSCDLRPDRHVHDVVFLYNMVFQSYYLVLPDRVRDRVCVCEFLIMDKIEK